MDDNIIALFRVGIRQFALTVHDLESLQPTQCFQGEPARLQSFVKQVKFAVMADIVMSMTIAD